MEDMMAENKGKADDGNQQRDDSKREGGFVHSPPEANVFPPGAAQTGHGSAGGKPLAGGNPGERGDSAAGTPDEGRLGGTGGTSASGTTGNDPDR
jgi:hypothetical protein